MNTLRTAMRQAWNYGYRPDARGALRAPPGKFQGEPPEAIYFYTYAMEGFSETIDLEGEIVGDGFELSTDEVEAFSISPEHTHAILWHNGDGFVTLCYYTSEAYRELTT